MTAARVTAAEMVDNPAYQAWAKHKPGTTVVLTERSTRFAGPTTRNDGGSGPIGGMTRTMTDKLIELTPEKAVIERSMRIRTGNRQFISTNTIPAKIEAGPAELPDDTSPARWDVTDRTEAQEELKIGDKTYQAKTTLFKVSEKSGKATGEIKVWWSQDVPGALLKTQAEIINNPGEPVVTNTITAGDIKEGP
jgi:hypothetical protein